MMIIIHGGTSRGFGQRYYGNRDGYGVDDCNLAPVFFSGRHNYVALVAVECVIIAGL